MGTLYDGVVKLLVCLTLFNKLSEVVITAESAEFNLEKLRTNIENIQTTAEDVMSISDELNSLDNINEKLELLAKLTEHMFKVTKKIISYEEFNDIYSFDEMKKTGLKIINLSSKIATAIQNIMFNPGSLPENAETIVFTAEEIMTLIHHLHVLSLKPDFHKSKDKYYGGSMKKNLENCKAPEPTPDLNYKNSKEDSRVRFKDTVTVYEYNDDVKISDSSPTVRKCTLNDEKLGFCLKGELNSEDVQHEVCKAHLRPSLKTYSSYEEKKLDEFSNSKQTEEEQCTLNTIANEECYCDSKDKVMCKNGVKERTCRNREGNSDEVANNENLESKELLSTPGEYSNQEAESVCQKELHGDVIETGSCSLDENCREKEFFSSSDNKGEYKSNNHQTVDESSCHSHPYTEECKTFPRDTSTHEKPSSFEESFTTESTTTSVNEEVSANNAHENENIYGYTYEKSPGTEQSTVIDNSAHTDPSVTTEDCARTETYGYSYDDSTTTESSSGNYNEYTSSSETTTTESYSYSYGTVTTEQPSHYGSYSYSESTTTTESYSYSYDTVTTEQPSYYGSYSYSESTTTEQPETTTTVSYSYSYDTVTTEQPSNYGSYSYSESTTTEQPGTTTERDLSTLSQNIYSVAQDLSTKASEISTVTSEISSKVSEISSALSDINTYELSTEEQTKIQELSKLTQEVSSKTSEISSLSSETSRLASDISTASNDIPNVDNKHHPHRISPRQRITSKSQDMVTSTQNIITAAQDIMVKIQDVSYRSSDLKPANMISTASHDITSRTQGIIADALDIVTAALEIMTSVDF